MKEKLDQLRADLEELEKTPLMLKPARAEKAVRRSFEIVSELAQTVEQLRFKVEAIEGVGQRMEAAAGEPETLDEGPNPDGRLIPTGGADDQA